MKSPNILDLCEAENWVIDKKGEVYTVEAYGQTFPLVHPFPIYGKLYKAETNPELKYEFMRKMHDYLWPQDIITWNYWTERRFKKYCEGWRIMSWAGLASCGKSVDAGKIALIEWLSSPKDTGVLVASTTIESLASRVYGYILTYLKESKVPLKYQLLRTNPQKIMYDRDDSIHTISAIAAAKGKDQGAIKNVIGRHTKRKLLLLLDEGPDLDPIILEALPNLEAGQNNFQCIVIGNPDSQDDLHGALSTPSAPTGWDSVDPGKDTEWPTTQNNGICLFFGCYESPAIHETDPVKKKKLSRFLITKEQIEEKKLQYGETSEKFYRMVLGFWKKRSIESKVLSEDFIRKFNSHQSSHFGGLEPLSVVAGLDPSFSPAGDTCLLRFAVLGIDVEGNYILDFRYEQLTFPIPIYRNDPDAAELQISKRIIQKLDEFRCPLNHMALDATGQGRALGSVLQLQAKEMRRPLCIYSTKSGVNQDKSFDVIIKTSYELWTTLKEFIQAGQIRGLDNKTIMQLSQREVIIQKNGTPILESKLDYKKRIGAKHPSLAHSPDHADAAALAVQSAIINFGFSIGKKRSLPVVTNFNQSKWLEYQAERQVAKKEEKKRMYSPAATFSAGIESLASKKFKGGF